MAAIDINATDLALMLRGYSASLSDGLANPASVNPDQLELHLKRMNDLGAHLAAAIRAMQAKNVPAQAAE